VAVNVPYTPGLSLLQVLEALGGPTPYADAENATILRKQTGRSERVDAQALWTTKDPARDVPLEPGDAVSIPLVNQVFVAGQVLIPGKVPYDPAYRVGDYLIASGGIDPRTGDPGSIWFVDRLGVRTRAGLGSPVAPGAVILVDENAWTKTQKTLSDIGVVTGFVAGIISFLTAIYDFYILVK
jgi:protein involved in polysaccharide export with SLBB domain